ncbi:MAG: Fic family protein [Nanoarchaeota archaeon]|nr:Fic family protein [Nanoarchaeota archaeon]
MGKEKLGKEWSLPASYSIELEKFIELVNKHKRSPKNLKYSLNEILETTELKEIQIPELAKIDQTSLLSEKEWLKFSETFTYNTNMIEGASISKRQVSGILRNDKLPANIEEWEIHETYGVADALKYLRDTRSHFSLKLVTDLHNIVFKNSKSFAGKLRSKGIEVVIKNEQGNIIHKGAPSKKVIQLLQETKQWYNINKDKYNPLVLTAVIHNQFENIHPFQDGNGRIGRLLLNNILMKHDLAPVNIEYTRRTEYYSALKQYQDYGEIQPMIELIQKGYNPDKTFVLKSNLD